MNVGQLRKLIESLPDDTELVVSGPDHSYERAKARVAFAGYVKGDFYEWHGPEHASLGEKEVTVLVVL